MEEDPGKTYPAASVPDLENMEETFKRDQEMKDVYQRELGKDFKSFNNGVCTGEVRYPPLGAMSPYEEKKDV